MKVFLISRFIFFLVLLSPPIIRTVHHYHHGVVAALIQSPPKWSSRGDDCGSRPFPIRTTRQQQQRPSAPHRQRLWSTRTTTTTTTPVSEEETSSNGNKKRRRRRNKLVQGDKPIMETRTPDDVLHLDNDRDGNKGNGLPSVAATTAASSTTTTTTTTTEELELEEQTSSSFEAPPNLDEMRARAGILRTSILQQQMELQRLERQIVCCSRDTSQGRTTLQQRTKNTSAAATTGSGLLSSIAHSNLAQTFKSSTNVLVRKIRRVQEKRGRENQKWQGSVPHYLSYQTQTAGRIVHDLFVRNPHRLKHLVDPETPTLLPHVPAILARLDRLEIHVTPILERVLNNRRHLASIEPYLDEILERFDDIEPHLPWILDNVDILAPYTGLLLKHIDELLLYARVDEHERILEGQQGNCNNGNNGNNGKEDYALADQLLPFLEYYVSRLDVIGPHLPLLRPHVPLLLKHNRIAKVSPHMDKLFRRGYLDLNVSANLDVLLFWFGWSLRIPGVPALFFTLPFSPRLCSLLSRRLPRRFARGYCSGVSCSLDGDYGDSWNQLSSKSGSSSSSGRREGQDYSI